MLDEIRPLFNDLGRVVIVVDKIRAAYPDATSDELVDRVTLEFMAPLDESAPETPGPERESK